MHIYEYMFTAIIIFSILLASSMMVVPMAQPSRNVSETEQLKVVAQKIMTQLILNTGDPPDWGSDTSIDENNLNTFGLAKYADTTRDAYVLDPDKVLRLDITNPLYVHPATTAKLLNLGNDYGFTISFHPALNVTITKSHGYDQYVIDVRTIYANQPIANAKVFARIYYVDEGKIVSSTLKQALTALDGKCSISFDGISTKLKILVVVVDYSGIRVVKTFHEEDPSISRAKIVGNRLFFEENYDVSYAQEIIVVKGPPGYIIQNLKVDLGKVDETIYDLAYLEPTTITVLASNGDKLIYASKEIDLTYSTIAGASVFPFSYTLERMVTIANSVYYVRLQVWRMSW
ncbi:MAG: hypothetical protein QW222_07710 [Candidatus Bathyarchaeia archaeon]